MFRVWSSIMGRGALQNGRRGGGDFIPTHTKKRGGGAGKEGGEVRGGGQKGSHP